jgi:hypothetical protein
LRDALQLVLAEVARMSVGHELAHCVRHDDLTSVTGRTDPCREVDVDAEVCAI